MTKTILLIEDNEQNSYLVTYLLEARGYAVISASDGTSGIAVANKLQACLILLDIQLPLMDGYQVAAELRKVSALDKVPIVAVTSYALVGDREKCIAAGCNGYIEKPIDPDTFFDEISAFLNS